MSFAGQRGGEQAGVGKDDGAGLEKKARIAAFDSEKWIGREMGLQHEVALHDKPQSRVDRPIHARPVGKDKAGPGSGRDRVSSADAEEAVAEIRGDGPIANGNQRERAEDWGVIPRRALPKRVRTQAKTQQCEERRTSHTTS